MSFSVSVPAAAPMPAVAAEPPAIEPPSLPLAAATRCHCQQRPPSVADNRRTKENQRTHFLHTNSNVADFCRFTSVTSTFNPGAAAVAPAHTGNSSRGVVVLVPPCTFANSGVWIKPLYKDLFCVDSTAFAKPAPAPAPPSPLMFAAPHGAPGARADTSPRAS